MEEEFSNYSDNQTFEEVLNGYMSRRQLIVGGVAGAALSFIGGSKASAFSAKPVSQVTAAKRAKIGFTSIPLQSSAMPKLLLNMNTAC
jgi:secreted PhoX family phosphatase